MAVNFRGLAAYCGRALAVFPPRSSNMNRRSLLRIAIGTMVSGGTARRVFLEPLAAPPVAPTEEDILAAKARFLMAAIAGDPVALKAKVFLRIREPILGEYTTALPGEIVISDAAGCPGLMVATFTAGRMAMDRDGELLGIGVDIKPTGFGDIQIEQVLDGGKLAYFAGDHIIPTCTIRAYGD
jgi:hypothetical protein